MTIIPVLKFMFAVPNGMHAASARHAAMLVAQGMTRGVLDVWLPHARGQHLGLAFEMKAPDGRLSNEQGEWLFMLEEEGWCVGVCHGAEEAKAFVVSYLALPCRRIGSHIPPSSLQAALLLTTRNARMSRRGERRAHAA